ncbi:MAG: hypothetical protein ACXWKN_12790 [Phenylobacterium sp.]
MDPERPPDIDAEYRLIHGPWPRWALQISLLKLALRSGAIVLVLCLTALAVAAVVVRFR